MPPPGAESIAATFVVRYGRMRFLGEFAGLEGREHPRGLKVVVRTDRGTELGEILCPATDRTPLFLENPSRGEILRAAEPADLEEASRLDDVRDLAFDACLKFVAARRIQLSLVDVEPLLGQERIVFYYLAEKRVDFRELVRDLARVLKTRIEMRQIGVRDEAKLLADYGDCGKPVCCNTHLNRLPPVSMRMAKAQKSTLDPSKISGRCGRLKCCLRYEFDTYQEHERALPPVGARVETARGPARVLAQEILAQRVLVELDDQRRVVLGLAEIGQAEHRARPVPPGPTVRDEDSHDQAEADEAVGEDQGG
jgi:cell fate regulator YaaT (PSP1 superfamily)